MPLSRTGLSKNDALTGNLSFASSGARIFGEFLATPYATRTHFQNSTANTNTHVAISPNGTGNGASLMVFANGSDPGNTSIAQFRCGTDTGDVRVSSSSSGSGTVLPLAFYAAGEKMRIESANGYIGMGTSQPKAHLHISSGNSGNCRVIIEADESNTVESYLPQLIFRADGGYNEAAIGLNDNALEIHSQVSAGGIKFYTGNNYGVSEFWPANTSLRGQFDENGYFSFNSGYGNGTQTVYGCRIWVNFQGTGTVAVRGSGGVSSVTDNGTGSYTVNFSFSLPDTVGAFTLGQSQTNNSSPTDNVIMAALYAVNSLKVVTLDPNDSTFEDTEVCCATIHR